MAKRKTTFKSQKGQNVPDLTEDQAREYLEKMRWPNGPACIQCGSVEVYKLQGESTRTGLIKCRDCKCQFSVTVGTVMEDSHLPLAKWVKAFHLMSSSKKGISALQLQRNLGLGSYRTAWHLAHRIRFAMSTDFGPRPKLEGTCEADETFVGGKPRKKGVSKPGRGSKKTPVFAVVQRDGDVRCKPIADLTALTLKVAIRQNVHKSARVMTDDNPAYRGLGKLFDGGHQTTNHRLEHPHSDRSVYPQ